MEDKKYIVAVMCTGSLKEARKWAARVAKKGNCSFNWRSDLR